jgi:hypothetical protein
VCKTRQKRKERKKVGEGLQWQEEDKATIGALLDVDVDARGKERGEVVTAHIWPHDYHVGNCGQAEPSSNLTSCGY